MTEQKKKDFAVPDFYITAPQPCPYLPGRNERKLFTHLTADKSPHVVDNLLRSGFRRSQNIAYTPYCDSCQACVSVRILAAEFEPGRTFRKTLAYNADVVARRIEPVPSMEQYTLFRDYIQSRHGDGGMTEMSVQDYALMIEDSIIDTFLTEYRIRPPGALDSSFSRWPLAGVTLCDRVSDGISMVYSYFDADEPERSLGTYMILENVRHAKAHGLPYVYLGYWIRGSRKMSYKTRFQPQEQLVSGRWVRA